MLEFFWIHSSISFTVQRSIEDGIGSHLQELTTPGALTEDKTDLHITTVEMRGIHLSFHTFQECLMDLTVMLMTDQEAGGRCLCFIACCKAGVSIGGALLHEADYQIHPWWKEFDG